MRVWLKGWGLWWCGHPLTSYRTRTVSVVWWSHGPIAWTLTPPLCSWRISDHSQGQVWIWGGTGKSHTHLCHELNYLHCWFWCTVKISYYNFFISQALGMLYWHGYCIDKALENMPNFCPLKGMSVCLSVKWTSSNLALGQSIFLFWEWLYTWGHFEVAQRTWVALIVQLCD